RGVVRTAVSAPRRTDVGAVSRSEECAQRLRVRLHRGGSDAVDRLVRARIGGEARLEGAPVDPVVDQAGRRIDVTRVEEVEGPELAAFVAYDAGVEEAVGRGEIARVVVD